MELSSRKVLTLPVLEVHNTSMKTVIIRYAVRPASTIRNWEVWEVVREYKDGGSREAWGKRVETVRTRKQAETLKDSLCLDIREN